METATATTEYRALHTDFLDKTWKEGVVIFKKTVIGGKPQFQRFAHYLPSEHDKIVASITAEDMQNFYITENDLVRYYKDCAIKKLQKQVTAIPPKMIIKKSHDLIAKILQEHFDSTASPRILFCLDKIVEVMENCLPEAKLALPEVYEMAGKEYNAAAHCASVGAYCIVFGNFLKLRPVTLHELGLGGVLHDIGKSFIKREIWERKDKLNEKDMEEVKKHSAGGKNILRNLKSYSENILLMVGEHHEKFDGSGYPRGVSGEGISLLGRMCAVADVFAALTTNFPHRQALPPGPALVMMKLQMPKAFDAKILNNFIRAMGPSGS